MLPAALQPELDFSCIHTLEVVGDTDSFILIGKITNYEGDKRKKKGFFADCPRSSQH